MSLLFVEKHKGMLICYEIWNKCKELKGKNFDVEVVHRDKYLTTKTIFYGNVIKKLSFMMFSTERTQCLTYSITLID